MADSVSKPVNSAQTSLARLPEAKQAGEAYVPLPDGREEGWLEAHSRQTIQADPARLYELWRNESGYPLWMEHVVSVTPQEGGRSHWVVGDPDDADGKRAEFDTQITEDIRGEKLAWKNLEGGPEQEGYVTFKARKDGRGSVVTVVQRMKVGKVANAVAGVVERSPKQTVIENLRHFKQMAEAGEIPSVKGNPHGPRGITGGVRKWMFGETNPTPPGTSEAAPSNA